MGEIEDGKRSIRSLTGVRRDSEVMYVGTFDQQGKRGKLQDVLFEESNHIPAANNNHEGLTRSLSQPDFLAANMGISREMLQEPASIFDRPGMGSIAFRYFFLAHKNSLYS